MNKQIEELAKQAGLGQERWNTTEEFNSFLEKFAELIVKQCAKVGSHYGGNVGHLILHYFGVEP